MEIRSSERIPLKYDGVDSESVGDLRVKKAVSLKRVHVKNRFLDIIFG